ncbi:MAG: hypothetical protein B6244_02200 [Candidatus Cloacimonetes bacterium 4572_55]|nr:MAG: hypothetical protein B6244_02200 [Candidatus Cloacimonetes bacterium 4572_55]
MVNYEILEAFAQIIKEKKIDREFLIEILETSILAASRKKFGNEQNLEIKIDDLSGVVEVYCYRTVVSQIENPNYEVLLRKALKLNSNAKIGGEVKMLIPFDDFGRNAVQNIRQMVLQRIREAEREKIHKQYSQRIGEVVTGAVQQVDKGNVIINIGNRIEAIMPRKEQIQKERFYQGDTVRGVIVDVTQPAKGPQIVISRTHDDFLRRLFELEVPEIFEGMVQIKSTARDPGHRSKIAVFSIDPRIDPIGACVGYKGSRVQAVVRELSGERIDIVPWHSDPKRFVANSLSPAKISNIILFAEKRTMTVIVNDDQLSLAIGKNGLNARLGAKLTNWRLDLLDKTQYEELLLEAKASEISLRELEGVSDDLIDILFEFGFETVQDLENMMPEELMEQIEELHEEDADIIIDVVDRMLDALEDVDEENKGKESGDSDNDEIEEENGDDPNSSKESRSG